jgi:hypothetical protein
MTVLRTAVRAAVLAAAVPTTVLAALASAAIVSAEPAPPPTIPDVNAFPPVSPVEYSVLNDRYYAFGTPDGLTCAFDRQNGAYGCGGPIPAAPNGANVVSAGAMGAPKFSSSDRPIFEALGPVKQLPPNTRMSFRTVSCTNDGAATTICVNSADQTGFVLTPAGSFLLEINPLVYRPDGTNPYFN